MRFISAAITRDIISDFITYFFDKINTKDKVESLHIKNIETLDLNHLFDKTLLHFKLSLS